jgi:hypothetical protein
VAREDIREVLLRPYRIVYRVVGSGIEVLTVFEGHRQLPAEELPPRKSPRARRS